MVTFFSTYTHLRVRTAHSLTNGHKFFLDIYSIFNFSSMCRFLFVYLWRKRTKKKWRIANIYFCLCVSFFSSGLGSHKIYYCYYINNANASKKKECTENCNGKCKVKYVSAHLQTTRTTFDWLVQYIIV